MGQLSSHGPSPHKAANPLTSSVSSVRKTMMAARRTGTSIPQDRSDRQGHRCGQGLSNCGESESKNESVSEHGHYWPYGCLEVMTWPQAAIDSHAIRGTLTDLRRLATLIERAASSAQPGAVIRIREEYAVDGDYALVLEFRDDNFDPASADPGLAQSPPP